MRIEQSQSAEIGRFDYGRGVDPASWRIPDEASGGALEESETRQPAKLKKKRPFKTADLKRAVKALQTVGLKAARVEFEPDGRFAVVASPDNSSSNNDLDSWIAKHARSS